MSDPDIRGYGTGIGTGVHNDPESHYRKDLEDKQETVDRTRHYTDIIKCDAVVISQVAGEFGGTTYRQLDTNQSGTTKYLSVIVRFFGPKGDLTFHPDAPKPNPLDAKNKDDFLILRGKYGTRVVREPTLQDLFGPPAMGTVVSCVKRNGVWEIESQYARSHEPYDDFIHRMANPNADSSQAPFQGQPAGSGESLQGFSHGTGGAPSSGRTSSSGGVPETIANPASNCEVPLEGRALLDMIAYNESRGQYNIRYGGDKAIEITDFSDHPRKPEKITRGHNTGLKSSAAGRYQFITGTWNEMASQEDLADFSPASQDKAAWALAKRDYKRSTGRNLMTDLKSGTPGDLNRIGRALSKTWTSLPGSTSGEELTSDSQFVEGYNNLLSNQKNKNACPDRSLS